MAGKHPEALHEMKDVMTNIGQKWEAKQYHSKTATARLNNSDMYPSSDSSLTEPIYASRAPPAVPPHGQSHYGGRRYSELSDVDLTELQY